MYSRIWTRLPWFFDYIGEPEPGFEVELYGDVNFDGYININDIIIIIGYVLNNQEPTEEQFLTADINEDGFINIQDVIILIPMILDD